MEIYKILGLCLITAFLAVFLKSQKSEYVLAVVLAGGAVITTFILKSVVGSVGYIREQLNIYGVETGYFKVALKALGIGYVTGFIADACRDSGQSSLAAKAEFAGKCAIFIISVPLIASVLNTALGFLK